MTCSDGVNRIADRVSSVVTWLLCYRHCFRFLLFKNGFIADHHRICRKTMFLERFRHTGRRAVRHYPRTASNVSCSNSQTVF